MFTAPSTHLLLSNTFLPFLLWLKWKWRFWDLDISWSPWLKVVLKSQTEILLCDGKVFGLALRLFPSQYQWHLELRGYRSLISSTFLFCTREKDMHRIKKSLYFITIITQIVGLSSYFNHFQRPTLYIQYIPYKLPRPGRCTKHKHHKSLWIS